MYDNTNIKCPFIYPFYLSKNPNHRDAIDLLLYNDHYCLIKNFNGLNYSITKSKIKKHFCKMCLCHFKSEEKLNDHIVMCSKQDFCKVVMPKKGKKSIIEFTKENNKYRVPISIHCDFECLTTIYNELDELDDEKDKEKKELLKKKLENAKTSKYQKHVPCMYGLHVVSDYPTFQPEPVFFTGPNAHEELLKKLKELENEIIRRFKYFPMLMTNEQKEEFEKETHCDKCKKPFVEDADNIKQYHLSGYGYYMGAVHSDCYKNYKAKHKIDLEHEKKYFNPKIHKRTADVFKLPRQQHQFIPVLFHNLKGYDAHFILQVANKYFEEIKPIATNNEKYISFTLGNFRFLDSYAFMSDSLEALTSNLKKTGIQYFKNTSRFFNDPNELDLITQKGVCPYDFMNSFDKFDYPSLPTREEFYSKLNISDITKEDYKLAQTIWKTFNCKTMRDYMDIYLKSDVLCQADVFEYFRDSCMKNYGLDPLYYYTAPGLAWDACFKISKIKLELITDIDMYLFFEQMKRGGISMIANRFRS